MDNEKYQNKYRIPSARLQTWDYRWAGSYFITICTKHREHYFGEVRNGKMQLSPVGVIADILWHEIKNRAKNVVLGEFVVMPNHIHGILMLNDDIDNDDVGNGIDGINRMVETGHALSLREQQQRQPTTELSTKKNIGQQRFQNIGKNSISSIIGSYKSAVTKHANRLGYEFAWQNQFYDHIIRNEKRFEIISNYIMNNPAKWEQHKFYQKE